MFNVVKIKKRGNRTFVFRLGNKIIKIPYSLGSWKEIQHEKACIEQVKNDPHFSNYLLEYKYIFGCPVTRYVNSFAEQDDSELIKKYFQKAFQNANFWQKKELKFLLEADIFLNFVLRHTPDYHQPLKNFLDTIEAPQSSVHGDFSKGNILVNDRELYFIDWSRYKLNSSRHFDLIDFYIFSKKRSDQSWIEAWEREYKSYQAEIFGIENSRKYFLGYGIWKVSHELKSLKSLNLLNRYKIKKYTNFIKIIIEFIQDL